MAVIFGTQGRDTIDGTGLDDIIRGWAEDGDPATDLGDLLSGLGGDDRLDGGGGGDALVGGDGQDELNGYGGADRLAGEDGADRLSGDESDDELSGGSGRDRFEFSRNYARDTISDFEDDVGTIALDGARLGVTSKADALSHATVVDGNTVFTFNTGDVLIVENIADPQLLRDDLAIL